jgi:hypothetical protein
MLARLMRQLVLLLLGLVVGAAGGVSVVNTLRQRDAYPRGVMDVMQHHYATLRDAARRGHCETAAQHLELLRMLGGQVATAVYGEDIPDASFREFDARLHDSLAPAPPVDCKALRPQLDKIGAACDACHREYR